jgi:hypothetical protein
MKSPTVARMMFGCFLLLSCLPLLAQTSVPVPVRPAHPVQRVREEPCWEQAGVSRTAMEQRRNIERSTRAEVESVCADSALSAQQKHEKIREIRERSRQEMEALVSPEQREAIRSCQESRGGGRHPGGGRHGGREGPCGEMPMSSPGPSTSKPEPPSSSPPPSDASPNP